MAQILIPDVLTVLTFISSINGCNGWEFCRTSYNYIYSYYIYCEYGCCGSYRNQYCCSNKVGIIVGAVFGGLVLLAVIIAIVLCCLQQKGKKGTIVRPAGQNGNVTNMATVAFINTSQNPHAMVHPPPYTAAPPPAYSQFYAYSPPNQPLPPQPGAIPQPGALSQPGTDQSSNAAFPPSTSSPLSYPPVSSAPTYPTAPPPMYPPTPQNDGSGSQAK